MRTGLLLSLFLCLAAGPTSRQAAEPWLDRANADLAAAVDAKDGDLPLNNIAVASALCSLRGNEADHAVLRRIIAKGPTRNPNADEPNWALAQLIFDVPARVRLGETKVAQERVKQSEAWLKTELGQKLEEGIADTVLAYLYIELGDYDQAARWQKGAMFGGEESLALNFHMANRPDLRDRAIAAAVAGAMVDDRRRWIATIIAKTQQFDQVGKIVRTIAEPRKRLSTASSVANYAAYAGRPAEARRIVAETITYGLAAGPQVEFFRPGELAGLFENSRLWDDKPDTLRLIKQVGDAVKDEPYALLQLAEAAVIAGDKPLALQYVDRAGEKTDPLQLARVYVRLGDKDRAAEQFRIFHGRRKEEWSYANGLTEYVVALADVGRGEEAVNLIDSLMPEQNGREGYLRHIARAEADGGRFDAAWDLSLRLENKNRAVGVQQYIARQALAAGKADGLAPRIAKLPDPRYRALVHLRIAEMLLGRDGTTMVGVYDQENY